MPEETKTPDAATEILKVLTAGMEAALLKPKDLTSDELNAQQHEANVQPNAFRRRLVKRRRALGQDDGIIGGSSGRADSAHRVKRGSKRK